MAIITVSDLTFRWRKHDKLILSVPELHIEQGQRVFIQGESGSGKSSLLNLLGGLCTPQSGNITVLDTDITALSAAKRDQFRADHIGFIFQQFNLVPYLSVIDNVLLATRFSKKRAAKLTDAHQQAKQLLRALHVPNDLIESRNVTQLSVGQQQRVAAARALIGSPPLLIADEPTSALDFNSREAFIELLFNECEKASTTLLFVSHDTSLGHLFSRKIQMSQINQVSAGGHNVAND